MFISMFFCIKIQASKIPNDLLNSPVAIVFYEFYFNDDRNEILEDIKQRLINKGVNVVSALNVSNEYEAKIAMADLRAKNVKYVYKLLTKTPAYYLNVYPFEQIKHENFRKVESSCFITEGANSLEKLMKKYNANIEKHLKKHELVNGSDYDITLVDTVLMLKSDEAYINDLLNGRNILSDLEHYNEKGIPKDIKESKIAFVKFQPMTILKPASVNNRYTIQSLKKMDLDIEFFENYEEYKKRKDEFDYRIVFTNEKLVRKQYVTYNAPRKQYKNGIKQTNVLLVSLCLQDEKTKYIYQCTRHRALAGVIKDFRKTLQNTDFE